MPDVVPARVKALLPAAIAEFERATVPATRVETTTLLARLSAHFPMGDRSEGQWKIVFEDFADDLADYPLDILREAVSRYRREGKWWPKVSEIVALADPLLARRQWTLHRLRALAEMKEPEVERDDPEERARRKAAVDEILRGLPQVAGI